MFVLRFSVSDPNMEQLGTQICNSNRERVIAGWNNAGMVRNGETEISVKWNSMKWMKFITIIVWLTFVRSREKQSQNWIKINSLKILKVEGKKNELHHYSKFFSLCVKEKIRIGKIMLNKERTKWFDLDFNFVQFASVFANQIIPYRRCLRCKLPLQQFCLQFTASETFFFLPTENMCTAALSLGELIGYRGWSFIMLAYFFYTA